MRAFTPLRPSPHQVFVVILVSKGLLGILQMVIAGALYFGVMQDLPLYVQFLFQTELAEDPGDFLAAHILALVQLLPAAASDFYTIYFAAHGALHLVVVAALLGGHKWAHQAAIIVLTGFVVYQIFEWFAVGGPMLIVLSVIDLLVIYLTFLESRARSSRS